MSARRVKYLEGLILKQSEAIEKAPKFLKKELADELQALQYELTLLKNTLPPAIINPPTESPIAEIKMGINAISQQPWGFVF